MVAIKFGVLDARKLDRKIRAHVQFRMAQSSNFAMSEALRTCPVRTGFLRSTVNLIKSGGSNYRFALAAKAFYAVFVHDGTRFMPARPWMRNAVERAMKMLHRNQKVKGNTVVTQVNTYPSNG